MRIVQATALATTDHYKRDVRRQTLPLEAPGGTALVPVQPMRPSSSAAAYAAGPNAGFVMQLIATAEPLDLNASGHPAMQVPGVAATAAYRAAARQAGTPANDIGAMSRTI